MALRGCSVCLGTSADEYLCGPHVLARPSAPWAPKAATVLAMSAEVTDEDERLFQRLRALRKQLADEYHVIHDRTKRPAVRRRPANVEELLEVPGVGRAKLQRYWRRLSRGGQPVGRNARLGANMTSNVGSRRDYETSGAKMTPEGPLHTQSLLELLLRRQILARGRFRRSDSNDSDGTVLGNAHVHAVMHVVENSSPNVNHDKTEASSREWLPLRQGGQWA